VSRCVCVCVCVCVQGAPGSLRPSAAAPALSESLGRSRSLSLSCGRLGSAAGPHTRGPVPSPPPGCRQAAAETARPAQSGRCAPRTRSGGWSRAAARIWGTAAPICRIQMGVRSQPEQPVLMIADPEHAGAGPGHSGWQGSQADPPDQILRNLNGCPLSGPRIMRQCLH
jgi:hypothetical protein